MKNLHPERRRQIALVYFDNYVIRQLLEPGYIITRRNTIDGTQLESLAKSISCNPTNLHAAIVNSLGRIARTNLHHEISIDDENKVIDDIVKLGIKESTTSMLNFKRNLGKIVRELNYQNFLSRVTSAELKMFIEPLLHEAVNENCTLIGRAELSPEKWHKLAQANFDRYVIKRMIESSFIVIDKRNDDDDDDFGGLPKQIEIDDRDLGNLAKQTNCNPDILRIAIINSFSRIKKEHFKLLISNEDEIAVTKSLAKLHIAESSIAITNYKREFGKITYELNHQNCDLHTTVYELNSFIEKLQHEAISEIYGD